MKYRITLIIIALFLVILIPISIKLRFSENIGLCHNDFLCESFWLDGVALPIYNSIAYVLASVCLMIFLPFSFTKLWLKIMVPYTIIALLLVISTPEVCGGMLCWDRTLVAGGLAKLFLILTGVIIVGKLIREFFRSRKKLVKQQ